MAPLLSTSMTPAFTCPQMDPSPRCPVFSLQVHNCSVDIQPVEARSLSLAPQLSTSVTPAFEIYVQDNAQVAQRYCWLTLYNSQVGARPLQLAALSQKLPSTQTPGEVQAWRMHAYTHKIMHRWPNATAVSLCTTHRWVWRGLAYL